MIGPILLLCFASQAMALAKLKTFRMANTREIESLDPALADGNDANIIVRGLFEGLVSLDPKTLQPIPEIARSWTISKDGLIYTFQLDDRAKWSDGEPVQADDFIFAWQRNLRPETGAFYSHHLKTVAGAKAEGNHTLVVTLGAPTPYFIELLSFPVFYPLPHLAMKKFGQRWTEPQNLISNGPFRLREWKLKEKMTLERNELYRDPAQVKLDRIEIHPIEDPKTAWNMYQAGQVDWIRSVPPALRPRLKNHPEFHSSPVMNTVYLRLNTQGHALRDRRVRRALSMALDRKTLTERVMREGQLPAFGFIAKGIPGYPWRPLIEENIPRARNLLAEAGFPNGRNFPNMTLLYPSNPQSEKLALAISTMLKRALNINVSPSGRERGVFYDKLGHLRYDVARSDWTTEFNDPKSYLDKFTADNASNNLTGYADAEYQRRLEMASRIQEPSQRFLAFARAEQQLVVDDAVIIPLYFNVSSSLWKAHVTGLVDNPRLFYSLKSLSLGQDFRSL
ncbi:MAG: peptide ABC transporter substrate-binding protein [Pseudobdellovibrionaceae bacterium]|nr:peptide ABC transporter substrate-binding protein [Pseudobdellovibrionaceae bacterium]